MIHKVNNAHFILVDNKSRTMIEDQYKEWGMKELLKRHNVTFIQFDLRVLSMRDLKAWCGISARSNIKNIKMMAISIDCTTLTKAGDCNYVRHRGKEGQALTIAAQWDSKMIRTIVKIVEEIEEMVPTALISIENGWHSHLKDMKDITKLRTKGFEVFKTDLCIASDETEDKVNDVLFLRPKKATAMIIKGIKKTSKLPRCKKGTNCGMKIEGSEKHRLVVSGKKHTRDEPRQKTIDRQKNSVLPVGLFLKIWDEHKRWLMTKEAKEREEWRGERIYSDGDIHRNPGPGMENITQNRKDLLLK
jgi:uncharacterized DUF497 family protein